MNIPVVVALFDLSFVNDPKFLCNTLELKKASACLGFPNNELFEPFSAIDLPKCWLNPPTATWEENAAKALQLFDHLIAEKNGLMKKTNTVNKKLAFISPLPPLRTGIAGYSDQLLPHLAQFYDIEIITNQEDLENAENYLRLGIKIKTINWFRENFHLFDRVLYHFGNSHFHSQMFSLIEDIPGVIVLHDFFLSGLFTYLEYHEGVQGSWARELYYSHGYPPLKERFTSQQVQQAIIDYPCNLSVIDHSLGVIVHSEHAIKMARQWYS